jgi:integrase
MKTNNQNHIKNTESESVWIKSGENLLKYKPSGVYFARVRVNGTLYRKSLKTTSLSTAKDKLVDFKKEKRKATPDTQECAKWTMGDVIDLFLERLERRQDIKESSKHTRRDWLTALLKAWPGFRDTTVSKVTKDDCLAWAERFSDYSAATFNAASDTLRMLFDLAVEKGARGNNPAADIAKKTIRLKELHLPSPEQFQQFVTEIKTRDRSRWRKEAADLVRLLAFTGLRIGEARKLCWQDVSFEPGTIRVRETKNGKPRTVPMISDARQLLLRLRSECPDLKPTDPVMLVNECPESMTSAAKRVPGMHRITHHDLRHLFATKAIESGVDIPTVSRWLGHSDGGALAMRVYGHLRDAHSTSMAAKVSFAVTPIAPAAQPTAQAVVNNLPN